MTFGGYVIGLRDFGVVDTVPMWPCGRKKWRPLFFLVGIENTCLNTRIKFELPISNEISSSLRTCATDSMARQLPGVDLTGTVWTGVNGIFEPTINHSN